MYNAAFFSPCKLTLFNFVMCAFSEENLPLTTTFLNVLFPKKICLQFEETATVGVAKL